MKMRLTVIILAVLIAIGFTGCSRYEVPPPGQTGTNFPICTAVLKKAMEKAVDIKNYDEAERLGRELLRRSEARYRPGHVEVAKCLVNLSEAYIKRGQPDKARPLLERALPVMKKEMPPDSFGLAHARMLQGEILAKDPGQAKRAEKLLSESLKYIGDDDPERLLYVRNRLAITLINQKKLNEAENILMGNLDLIDLSERLPEGEEAETLLLLLKLFREIGKTPSGKKHLLELAKPMAEKAGEEHCLMVPLYLAQASMERQKKNFRGAAVLIEKAASIPSLAMLYYREGIKYHRDFNLPEAARYLEMAIKAEPDPDSFPEDILLLLGETYEVQNLGEKGLPYMEKALSRAEEKYGENSKQALAIKSSMLELYSQERWLDRAAELGEELISIGENLPNGGLFLFRTITDMGKVYLEENLPGPAVPYCERGKEMALTYHIKIYEDPNDLVLHRMEAFVNMGTLYMLQGEYGKAVEEFRYARGQMAKRIEQHPGDKYNLTVSFTYIYDGLRIGCDEIRSRVKDAGDVDYIISHAEAMKKAVRRGDFRKALEGLNSFNESLDFYIKNYPGWGMQINSD